MFEVSVGYLGVILWPGLWGMSREWGLEVGWCMWAGFVLRVVWVVSRVYTVSCCAGGAWRVWVVCGVCGGSAICGGLRMVRRY